MRTAEVSLIFLLCGFVLTMAGCGSELQDLRVQNNTQRERISQLESEMQVNSLQVDKLKRQLESIHDQDNITIEALRQEIAALELDISRKKELIASMQERLLMGGEALPVELSTMLEDFAKDSNMVTYDAGRGVVKFESDLLFDKGSDIVSSGAIESLRRLCDILNSSKAQDFDIIIAGHTDDIPIQRPDTRQKHPTNWHLSAHRAIAVLNVMASNKIDYKRMSIRGFGEFRPVEPNKEGKQGNPQNRRVEIYIVAKGT